MRFGVVGRFGLLLLQFTLPVLLFIGSAHANGVNTKLASMQPVTGTITGKGSDSYSFNVAQGTSFVVTVVETGAHDPNFMPMVELDGPRGAADSAGQPSYVTLVENTPADGAWTVKVSRADTKNTSGSSYTITLLQAPVSGATPLSAPVSGGAGAREKIDAWTFNGTAGRRVNLSFNAKGGDSFSPTVYVFSPTGALFESFGCDGQCDHDTKLPQNGAYTVAVSKAGNVAPLSYTLSVTDQN